MSKKLLSAALALSAFALPVSYAFAQHGGGHGGVSIGSMHDTPAAPAMPTTHTNNDAHGEAGSQAAANARADDTKVGTAVSDVAKDKNKGKHEAKGHGKTHGH